MRLGSIIFAALLAMPLGASTARSQDNADRTRVAIELTDQRIGQAEMLVSSSDNELARDELGRAIEIQARAKVELSAGHLRLAYDLTLRARAHADRAVAVIRGLPDPDRVVLQLERTRDVIERARDRVEECDNDRARAMLRASIDMQSRAEAAVRAGRYLAALQLTMSARERALRALRMCHMEENFRESAERALRRTEDVIVRARDVVADCDREAGEQAFSHALELQERAQAEFRAGRYEATLRLTHNARVQALRSVQSCRGT